VTVRFTFFTRNYCPCVVIMSGKSDACADEPKHKMKRCVMWRCCICLNGEWVLLPLDAIVV
jgi:hypothetical protein